MIDITTRLHSTKQLQAAIAYMQALLAVEIEECEGRAPPAWPTIAPEDNPAAGIVTEPQPSTPTAAQAFAPQQPAAAATVPSVPVPPQQPVPVAAPAVATSASGTAPPLAPPVAAPAPSSAVDAKGLPWDGRIHSTPPKQNADGTWRQKRGSQPLYVSQVEAELRAAQGAPAPAAVPTPPAPLVTNAGAAVGLPVPHTAASVPFPPTAPAAAMSAVGIPTSTATPAPAGSAAGAPPNSLPALMQQLAPLMAQGRVGLPQVNAACAEAGVPSLAVLGTRADLVPAVWANVQRLIAEAVPA